LLPFINRIDKPFSGIFEKIGKRKDGFEKPSCLARSTEKDITGFFEKAACGKAFSAFFINPYCLTCSGCDTFSFFVRTEKDIR
jgi:hypothetical protein